MKTIAGFVDVPTTTTNLPNLVGNQRASDTIIRELAVAGIDLVTHQRELYSEVATVHTGELGHGQFTFTRAWTYWVLGGEVPLKLAQQIYNHGKHLGIRAGGHGGNLSPDTQVAWSRAKYDMENTYFEQQVPDSALMAGRLADPDSYLYVDTYHIDSPEGLKYMIDCLKFWFDARSHWNQRLETQVRRTPPDVQPGEMIGIHEIRDHFSRWGLEHTVNLIDNNAINMVALAHEWNHLPPHQTPYKIVHAYGNKFMRIN